MNALRATALSAAWRIRDFDYFDLSPVMGEANVALENLVVETVAGLGDNLYRLSLESMVAEGDVGAIAPGAVIRIGRGEVAGYYEVVQRSPLDRTIDVYSQSSLEAFSGAIDVFDLNFEAIVEFVRATVVDCERWTDQSWREAEERHIQAEAAVGSPHLILGCIPREIISAKGINLAECDLPRARKLGVLTRLSGACWRSDAYSMQIRLGYAPEEWPEDFRRGFIMVVAARFLSEAADTHDEGVEQAGADGYSESFGEGGRFARTVRNLFQGGRNLIMQYAPGVVR